MNEPMVNVDQRTGRVTSGDVSLFYHDFDRRGRPPPAVAWLSPRISQDRARAELALVRVKRGYMCSNAPDFQNAKAQGEELGASLPQR
jgi:hypothetical protein